MCLSSLFSRYLFLNSQSDIFFHIGKELEVDYWKKPRKDDKIRSLDLGNGNIKVFTQISFSLTA